MVVCALIGTASFVRTQSSQPQSLATYLIVIFVRPIDTTMALKTEDTYYVLPMARLCPIDPNAKILDCFLSNYQIEQALDHVVRFTKLDEDKVVKGIELLVNDKLIEKSGNGYITNFRSDRLIGLYSYYRATLGSNLTNVLAPRK